MIYKRAFAAGIAVFLFISAASAQKAEVTISLNEAFFDALLDSVFNNFAPPEFPIAGNFNGKDQGDRLNNAGHSVLTSNTQRVSSFANTQRLAGNNPGCIETVKILREMNGVRTSVRFRDGKIVVPLAFVGSYSPPFIGCVEFAGVAETNIDLEFDQNSQKLVGRARVLNVNLNGSGGIGGTLIAKLIQSSIDKKINPLEIMSLDKVSFGFPIQKIGNLHMKARKIRPEISNGLLNIRVDYEFLKG